MADATKNRCILHFVTVYSINFCCLNISRLLIGKCRLIYLYDSFFKLINNMNKALILYDESIFSQ